ncbi:MAG: DNA-directed RNA polymerase subunit B [bacterium]|nr:DNA-directed RNA polymerase subunit B [bacterium]
MRPADVIYNGKYIGKVENPAAFVEEVKKLRRHGKLPLELNIAYIPETNEVHIYTDDSRLRRPLIVVKNGKPLLTKKHLEQLLQGKLTWNDLVRQGVIEYLDACEEENAYIALYPDELTEEHTHLEILPYIFLCLFTGNIPFLEHLPFQRITIAVSKAKRALGYTFSNWFYRVDTELHLQYYVQSPLVTTKYQKISGIDKRPYGFNVVVALLSYEGYNMEDAIVFNKASIERGLFRSVWIRTYKIEQNLYPGGTKDEFGIPDKYVQGYRGEEKYHAIDEDGLARPEEKVREYDVLVGRISPPRFLQELIPTHSLAEFRRDSSLTVRPEEEGIVDSVFIIYKEAGLKKIKVRVRNEMVPEIGDKFNTWHGQKGVIGYIAPQEDLPFSAETGIVPDLLFDPHSIPSRMTVSYLLEMLTGKAAALKGYPLDATPFRYKEEEKREMYEHIKKILAHYGFKSNGTEVFYDGITGEKLKMEVFTGVVYYQKLSYMAATKYHVRARGPVQVLTKQPTEGKSKEGGIKFGEMEKDALLGYGAAASLVDRYLENSDAYEIWVDKNTGLVCYYDYNQNKVICPSKDAQPVKVVVPYAFKLLLDELIALGIWPRLKVSDIGENK